MLKEFKEFAMKGNVVDLAVGVIIGGAFNKIVTSLVNDIIMPVLSLVLGRINVAGLTYTLPAFGGGKEIVVKYGLFLQNILDFIIMAFSIFLIVKFINRFKRKEEAKDSSSQDSKESNEEKLLTEIRDLLKSQNNPSKENNTTMDSNQNTTQPQA
ncbi:large conductance mechanosensitive channel [Clostridium punense]|uniref:Large-conductance mechanosensitive channel n=1 Tax=Clostridium punense TaxID=1054297 RepID=A0ABS4K956_9CLOT|nr:MULTISPECIES: large-conductance mechanosensitive channel protein MscL [Clostridium]EQB89751.1 hypothetical protein M918_19075 [Clostridium sp. BL8]MBP2024310.1 large conductance mechanosensitive channel [Clostridium punense]